MSGHVVKRIVAAALGGPHHPTVDAGISNRGLGTDLGLVVAENDNVQGPDVFTPDLYPHLTGDTPAAIETEKRALSLIPGGADASRREELETNLRTLEAALAETDKPPADGGDR